MQSLRAHFHVQDAEAEDENQTQPPLLVQLKTPNIRNRNHQDDKIGEGIDGCRRDLSSLLVEAVALHERQPGFLYGYALESFDESARKIEGEVRPEDNVQDDKCTVSWIEDAEIE